jgi:hypothetical protein
VELCPKESPTLFDHCPSDLPTIPRRKTTLYIYHSVRQQDIVEVVDCGEELALLAEQRAQESGICAHHGAWLIIILGW